jgi:hypothetical protein
MEQNETFKKNKTYYLKMIEFILNKEITTASMFDIIVSKNISGRFHFLNSVYLFKNKFSDLNFPLFFCKKSIQKPVRSMVKRKK